MSNTPRHQGRFIVFEGGDGAGKSTQIALLAEWLRQRGQKSIVTREPGGTPLAEELRTIALQGTHAPVTELLLIVTARHDHLHRLILPALEEGQWVLCDRFVDSTLTYQGKGLGIDTTLIRALHQQVNHDLWPDLTVTLSLGEETQKKRKPQAADGIEARDSGYQRRVNQGFAEIARQTPQRHLLLSADQTRDAIHLAICQRVTQQFSLD